MSTAIPTVREFMTTEPCAVDAELTLADAADRMAANNIRHLLVVRGDRLAGVVSTRDVSLASALSKGKTDTVSITTAMSEGVYTCTVDAPLSEVALAMESNRYGCAVALEDNVVVGIFTTTDALRAVRQLIAGHEVPRAVIPTHKTEVSAEREVVPHDVRVGASLLAHRAGPNPNMGTIR